MGMIGQDIDLVHAYVKTADNTDLYHLRDMVDSELYAREEAIKKALIGNLIEAWQKAINGGVKITYNGLVELYDGCEISLNTVNFL